MSGTERRGTELRGAFTAIVTPFDERGAIDVDALRRLVEWQIASGIDGISPCGTTGEGATLSPEEQRLVLETVLAAAAGRVPVIAGCGTNDTRRTIEAALRAAEAGATALLVVTPYYNKPNRSGMIAHYEAVAAATDLPVVVYNVPGRTGQNIGAELTLRLAEIPKVRAVKEASANLEQMAAILERRPKGFAVLSGDDALALPGMALGADGLVSVVSNQAPAETVALISAAASGDFEKARAIHYRLLPLMRANFVETNPVPVKVGLKLLGRCRDSVRAPLGPAEASTRRAVEEAIDAAGLAREPR